MKNLVAAFALLALTGCAGNYKPTFQHAADAEPVTVYVAPVLNQEEMTVQIVTADSSAATAQYGLIGALVGSVIDSAVNNSRAKKAERRAEVLRDISADYDFIGTAKQTAINVGNHERWKILAIDDPISTDKAAAIAAELFDNSDADAIALLSANYALTPTMDQVRADIDQTIYLRADYTPGKRARADSSRTLSYFSPYHPLDYREFAAGEKAAMKDALQAEYDVMLTRQPDDADELKKTLDAEIKDLDEAETIPDHVAIRETWTAPLLRGYLTQSVDHLAYMLQIDWSTTVVPETAQRTKDQFKAVNHMGMALMDKGEEITRRDGNIIYRSQWGGLYSVPQG